MAAQLGLFYAAELRALLVLCLIPEWVRGWLPAVSIVVAIFFPIL